MKMVKVALTGGPCGGKSSAMEYLRQELHGWKVVVAPEAATEVILEGNVPGTFAFQKMVFERQLLLEHRADEEAAHYDKVVVLCDRSLLDQLAYVTPEQFQQLLNGNNLSMDEVISRYNGFIHLVSAAVGTDCYTTANNPARKGTAENAIRLEGKTRMAYDGVPNVIVVDNSTGFEDKLARVLKAVQEILAHS